mmetsp:Transcript_31961/g.53901  ORF Transcript_31961/g.53901 Transcript_31961/m.53901 type:complete len:224 (+) Transcript_31961:1191-1862(+)
MNGASLDVLPRRGRKPGPGSVGGVGPALANRRCWGPVRAVVRHTRTTNRAGILLHHTGPAGPTCVVLLTRVAPRIRRLSGPRTAVTARKHGSRRVGPPVTGPDLSFLHLVVYIEVIRRWATEEQIRLQTGSDAIAGHSCGRSGSHGPSTGPIGPRGGRAHAGSNHLLATATTTRSRSASREVVVAFHSVPVPQLWNCPASLCMIQISEQFSQVRNIWLGVELQ